MSEPLVEERSRRRPDRGRVVGMTSSPSAKPYRPVITCQADLERMWRRLMTPLGFSGNSLWMVVLEDNRPLPQITEITAMPETPDEHDIEALARVLAEVVEPGERLAFLRARPGGGTPTADDREWARALYAAGRRSGVLLDVVHLAHDHSVMPLPMDDLLQAEPA
jgi:hypothetical protein